MPLYPLSWQDTSGVSGQERKTMIDWMGSRLRNAQDQLARLRLHDPDGLLLGSEAVVKDMLALKAELESCGFMYTIPDHLRGQYDDRFAPLPRDGA